MVAAVHVVSLVLNIARRGVLYVDQRLRCY
jgi:hypothetical protein